MNVKRSLLPLIVVSASSVAVLGPADAVADTYYYGSSCGRSSYVYYDRPAYTVRETVYVDSPRYATIRRPVYRSRDYVTYRPVRTYVRYRPAYGYHSHYYARDSYDYRPVRGYATYGRYHRDRDRGYSFSLGSYGRHGGGGFHVGFSRHH